MSAATQAMVATHPTPGACRPPDRPQTARPPVGRPTSSGVAAVSAEMPRPSIQNPWGLSQEALQKKISFDSERNTNNAATRSVLAQRLKGQEDSDAGGDTFQQSQETAQDQYQNKGHAEQQGQKVGSEQTISRQGGAEQQKGLAIAAPNPYSSADSNGNGVEQEKEASGMPERRRSIDNGQPATATPLRPLRLPCYPPMYMVVKKGDGETLAKMLAAGISPNDRSEAPQTMGGRAFRAPLHYAGIYGRADLMRALLDAGAEPDLLDQHSWPCLHYVALNGRVDLAEMLVVAGASTALRITTNGGLGETAMEFGRRHRQFAFAEALEGLQTDDGDR